MCCYCLDCVLIFTADVIFINFQANNCGPLQIISEYYRLTCPARGSALRFHPLEHLHPLEYHRPDETILHLAGSTVDLKSCSTGLEFAEVCYINYDWIRLLFLPLRFRICVFWIVSCLFVPVRHIILFWLRRRQLHYLYGL